jgi:SNF family Na+-dependent transporter
MGTEPLQAPGKEKWGSRLGVVLAVAGSAVGLGNFLRFPGQAVNHGGGAFMIPYILSFLLVGIPIAWCEWTLGRLGGRFGQNNAPGIMYAIWRRGPAKGLGALALLIPVTIYMYYILLEAWCLDYCISFLQGGFARVFADATQGVAGHQAEVAAVVTETTNHFQENCGLERHGAYLEGGRMIWLVLASFLINFFIIYQGVTRGIEKFCKWAMPLLILCALIILFRVLTLPNISTGLGFMWNPDWNALKDPHVWLAASGQIFFSLSVGFGLILCYSSYLRENDDVVLTSLSASSTNEFCEVILGGMIVVPTAFLFLGADNATGGDYGTFGIGFVTVPAIMHFMPGGPFWGSFFGAMWFGLLFLAAVTSSLSMLQPAVAFLEDGFGLKRRASVSLLGVITAIGAALTMYFTKGLLAMDYTDFWCNLSMILAATALVIIFGWVIGAERGVKETNRGADFHVPRFLPFMLRYVTPTFLIVILGFWTYTTLPGYLAGMNPAKQGPRAAEAKVRKALGLCDALSEALADPTLDDEQAAQQAYAAVAAVAEPGDRADLATWVQQVRADAAAKTFADEAARNDFFCAAITRRFGIPPFVDHEEAVVAGFLATKALTPRELAGKIQRESAAHRAQLDVEKTATFVAAVRAKAAEARATAAADANIARLVFLGILVFYILLIVLSDIACRSRIGRAIAQAEEHGIGWEAA